MNHRFRLPTKRWAQALAMGEANFSGDEGGGAGAAPVRPAATLVLGGQPRIVVAVARSLHRRGIPVISASVLPSDAVTRSRALRSIVTLPDFETDPAGFGRALFTLIEREGVDCLMVGSDQALSAIAPLHDELSRRVRMTCPPPQVVRRVLDKEAALQAAAAAGVPVPRTHAVRDGKQLESLLPALRFPLIVKRRAHGLTAAGRPVPRLPELDAVLHCADAAELRTLAAGLDDFGGRWHVQDFHAGDDVFLALLVHRGEAVARFQCRAAKTLPRRGGPGVMTVAEPVDETLAAQAMALLRSLGWEGLAQLDFRRDRRTGRWVFLEVNGRFWGSAAAAIHSGVDFPWYAWQQAHGVRPAPPASYRPGRRVRWLTGDLRRIVAILGGDRGSAPLGRAARWREAARFVADFRPTVAGMIWSWRDPSPALAELGLTVWYWLLTRWRHRRAGGSATARPEAERPDPVAAAAFESEAGPPVGCFRDGER